jgi:N-acetylmuramoyl-L-alanine amidase
MTRLASITTAAVAPVALAFADDTYLVRPGDTASEIAAEHDTTVAAIVAANDLAAGGDLIFVGETLVIPSAHGSPTEADRGRPGHNARRTVWHTVQPGDTVTALAVRYHAWTDEIIARNRLSASADISVGDRLRIPVVLAALPRHRQPQQQQQPSTSTDGQQAARLENRLPNPSHQHVRHVIERVSARYGVDPDLALAVSWQEAGWQQDHVSSAWAIGAMQVLPSTGEWIETLIERDLDLHRLRPNVTAGVVLLRELTGVASLPRAVAGYYQGLQSVRDHGMSADTKQYVRNVLYLKAQYEQGDYPY